MDHGGTLRLAGSIIRAAWVVWLVVWLLASPWTKRTVRRESVSSRLSYGLPMAISVLLLFLPVRHMRQSHVIVAGWSWSWLYARFVPLYAGVVLIGAPLVLAGVLVMLWARLRLAGNWSGSVTLKQDHELVRTGPYRYVRHPIYTGLLMVIAGTACAIGEARGPVAFALMAGAFWRKSRIEEHLMIDTFGDAYRRYRAEVKALIPFIL